LFGVFKHTAVDKRHPLFRGFDDEFYIPHSRHTSLSDADIAKSEEVVVPSESEEAGTAILTARGGREVYPTWHSECGQCRLNDEYVRDMASGAPIGLPRYYYTDDDPLKPPVVRWTSHAHLLFNNWLTYFVYQETPFTLSEIADMG